MNFSRAASQPIKFISLKQRTLHSKTKTLLSTLTFSTTPSTRNSTLSKLLIWRIPQLRSFKPQATKCREFECLKCQFHTSSRRYVGPYVWVIVKTLLKGGSILTGRGFRQWWKTLPDNKRLHFISLSKKQWKKIVIGITALCVAAYAFYWTHLQVAPITGRERFIAFTDKQFIKVMEFEAQQFEEQLKEKYLPPDHPYYKYVVETIKTLVIANQDIKEIQSQNWVVAIIDDPEVNAFVLPTGHVFVHKGLLDFVIDRNQLAIVLGHEMAHALLKHGAEQLSKIQLVDYFVIMVMAALWAFIPTDGIALITQWFFHKVVQLMIHMPYNRALETEADKVGLELAAKACYDIRMGTVFWSMMAMKSDYKGENVPEWLSTHPASDKRSELFDCLLPKYIEKRCEFKCPPLPDVDPRKKIPAVKLHIDNLVTAKKTGSNIERFKIPMTQYSRATPPAALTSNSSAGTQSEIPVEIIKTATSEKLTGDTETSVNTVNVKGDTQTSIKLSGDTETSIKLSGDTETSIKLTGDTETSIKLSGDTETFVTSNTLKLTEDTKTG